MGKGQKTKAVTKKEKTPKTQVKYPLTVHVPVTLAQKAQLDKMAEDDRRKYTDFMRVLIEQEWERRKQAAKSR